MPSDLLAQPPQIAIIGGGFSGATVALNLLRKLPANAAGITLIEPRNLLGGGVAYSSTDPAHRLNVPASRMLVLCEEPGAFEEWFKSSGALAQDREALLDDGRIYARRAAFGQYVDITLREEAAIRSAPAFRHIQATAQSIRREDSGFRITTSAGEIAADIVVLAVSHPQPGVPAPLRPIAGADKFIGNPWRHEALRGIGTEDRILIIGTALSTADVIASLHAQGHHGKTLAVSRRGLVSRLRKMAQAEPYGDFCNDPSRTAVALLRRARRTMATAEAVGSSWGAVIDAMRIQGLTIWSALPPAEKSRLLRHLRTFWDVHRYQVAPQLAAITQSQCESGRLSIRAARIETSRLQDGNMQVSLKFRGETPVWEEYDAVINCTGPDHAHVIETNPVLASLGGAGLIAPDRFGLGLQTDLTARALNAAGTTNPNLFVSGPLARAAFGELMGLPQVSQHAALVAEQVAHAVAENFSKKAAAF